MVDFEFKGICVNATAEISWRELKDSGGHHLNRFDRNTSVKVSFWDFVIYNDFYELAMVKSSLNYFMQAYWKRSSKAGSKIELATALKHDFGEQQQSLYLVIRQKNSIHSLEISLIENGKTASTIYLSGQEVIMLDIAIGKAINLLTPETIFLEN